MNQPNPIESETPYSTLGKDINDSMAAPYFKAVKGKPKTELPDLDEIMSIWWDGHNQCDDSCSMKYQQAEAIAAINELRRKDMEFVIGEKEPRNKYMSNTRIDFCNALKTQQLKRLEERLNEPE